MKRQRKVLKYNNNPIVRPYSKHTTRFCFIYFCFWYRKNTTFFNTRDKKNIFFLKNFKKI